MHVFMYTNWYAKGFFSEIGNHYFVGFFYPKTYLGRKIAGIVKIRSIYIVWGPLKLKKEIYKFVIS